MPSGSFQIFNANNPYEKLISAIMRTERQQKVKLEDRREAQQDLQSVLSDTDSKLSSLESAITPFTAGADTNPFQARSVTQASDDAYTVTASDGASLGSHTLEVEELAKADNRISKQLTSGGNDLRTFFDNNGQQTFDIEVAHPTDANPDNRVNISVTVNPTGSTNEEILTEIKSAIDTAMDDAVNAGTIKDEEKVAVSVINETSDTVRLSVRSPQTGYTNRLGFTDSANGLLTDLEINRNQVASGTNGGQVHDVGTGETDSALNSKFIVDGLTLYRDSNTVTDALDDLTIDLIRAGDPATEFTVETDTESITGEVQNFIDSFNEVQKFLRKKTRVDEDTQTRGPLADDFTFRSLRLGLRDDAIQEVSSQPDSAPKYLSDIGIEMNEDGTLSLANEEKLTAAIEDNASDVQSLFAASDGVTTRIKNRLGGFLGIDGLIDAREDSTQSKIDRLSDQISREEDRLARREETLRERFAQIQQTIQRFQSQQRSLSFFDGG